MDSWSGASASGATEFVAEVGRVPAGLIYSTVVPAGSGQLGGIARPGVCRTTGGGNPYMRVMKIAMAICAVCATMLAMSGIRRMRKMNGHKRRGMMRSRHR